MLALEVDRRDLAEGRVAPARVVEALDEVEDGHPGLGLGAEALTVEQLALERGEEALAECVVVRIADRSHRRVEVVGHGLVEFDQPLVAAILTAGPSEAVGQDAALEVVPEVPQLAPPAQADA